MAEIIPAILTSDETDLQNKINQLAGLVDWLQIDIMDGRFVPEVSVTPGAVAKISLPKNLNLEFHLMVENPLNFLTAGQLNQVRRIYFHLEPLKGEAAVKAVLAKIDSLGLEKGIAINPETPIEKLAPYLDRLDAVMLLSVIPGKQGQGFIPEILEKVKALKKLSPRTKIAVDGGIGQENILSIALAGADYLAVGSAVVKNDNPGQALAKLRQKLAAINY